MYVCVCVLFYVDGAFRLTNEKAPVSAGKIKVCVCVFSVLCVFPLMRAYLLLFQVTPSMLLDSLDSAAQSMVGAQRKGASGAVWLVPRVLWTLTCIYTCRHFLDFG